MIGRIDDGTLMKVVQLIDDIRIHPLQDTVGAIDEAARNIGADSMICSKCAADDFRRGIASKSVLLGLSRDDLLILHVGLSTTSYLLDFLGFKGMKCLYYHDVPVASCVMDSDRFLAREIQRRDRQLSLLSDHVDLCIATTSSGSEHLAALGFSCPIHLNEPVIEIHRSFDAMPARSAAKSRVTVLAVGDIREYRDYESVLDAFAFYQRAYEQDSSLVIVGSFSKTDPYHASLQARARALGIERCVLLDSLDFLSGSLEDADVLFSMAAVEDRPFGYVLAMRSGVPIVAYGSRQVSDIVGDAGVLLADKDKVGAARALSSILADGDLREEMKGKGTSRAELFSKDAAVRRSEALLADLVRS